MTDWFGHKYNAPIYDEGRQVGVPVGMACWACRKRIEDGDDGFQLVALMDVPKDGPPEWGPASYHRDCLLDMILGPEDE